MPCYQSLEAWRQAGSKSLTFKPKQRLRLDLPASETVILIPCGRCIGCRLERSRQWAVRCVHESRFHDENYFLTFTFNDEHLPEDNSIRTWHLQEFWKRVREDFRFKASECYDFKNIRFKYYAAGEYGEQYGRVHYHAATFGLPLPDKKFFKKSGDFSLYTSEWLSTMWPWGHVYAGDLTFESAAYVARYITKKVLGEDAEEHYKKLGIEPERAWMSKGLGKQWLDAFLLETYRDDMLICRGKEMRPPKAYDRWLELQDPEKHAMIKKSREIDLDDKLKILDELHTGRHDVAKLVKEAQLTATRLDRGR